MAKKRISKWTSIYWDYSAGKCYIRLTPVFVAMEALGFSHGISISGNTFVKEEEANLHADKIDKFMDALEKRIIEEYVAVKNFGSNKDSN